MYSMLNKEMRWDGYTTASKVRAPRSEPQIGIGRSAKRLDMDSVCNAESLEGRTECDEVMMKKRDREQVVSMKSKFSFSPLKLLVWGFLAPTGTISDRGTWGAMFHSRLTEKLLIGWKPILTKNY